MDPNICPISIGWKRKQPFETVLTSDHTVLPAGLCHKSHKPNSYNVATFIPSRQEISLKHQWLLLIAAVLKLHLFFFVLPLSLWQHSKKLKCHIKPDSMLICNSQRASESALVDFVTEKVSCPPISTHWEENEATEAQFPKLVEEPCMRQRNPAYD